LSASIFPGSNGTDWYDIYHSVGIPKEHMESVNLFQANDLYPQYQKQQILDLARADQLYVQMVQDHIDGK